MKKIIFTIVGIAFITVAFKRGIVEMTLTRSITIDSLGACQGIS
jgi:hypothetical protein